MDPLPLEETKRLVNFFEFQPSQQTKAYLTPTTNLEFSTYYHANSSAVDNHQEEDDEDDVDQEDENSAFEQDESDVKPVEKQVSPARPPPVPVNPSPKVSVVDEKIVGQEQNKVNGKKEDISVRDNNELVQTPSKKRGPKGQNRKKDTAVDESSPTELLKENRVLRKKVETLMKHNMQLMVGIKDRDNKIYKQKRLLSKYRKALLRFFENNESGGSSSSADSEQSLSSEEGPVNLQSTAAGSTSSTFSRKSIASAMGPPSPFASPIHDREKERDKSPSGVLPSPSPESPFPLSSALADPKMEPDDGSSTNGDGPIYSEYFVHNTKKRKYDDNGDDSKSGRKKQSRRNTLWSAEDDELFTKVYNVYGKSWKTIHNFMPGKTREQVQSHGQYLIRIGKLEDIKSVGRRGRRPRPSTEKSTPTPTPTSISSEQMSFEYSG
jgi:hypothetical protein